jgi:outer membrane protein assembly factor BamB
VPTEETTYLELSEVGGAHKFYETTVRRSELTIRYGRIGTQGQTTSTTFATPAVARAEADRKIQEKLRKGYQAPTSAGQSAPAATTRPNKPPSSPKKRGKPTPLNQAPVLWHFSTGSTAYGLFVDASRCWVGNGGGRVFVFDHNGQLLQRFALPSEVNALVGDDLWTYAGCGDGDVYDLSRRVPRPVYSFDELISPDGSLLGRPDLLALDVCDGTLVVSDNEGSVTAIDPAGQLLWTRRSSRKSDWDPSSGWMVRLDRRAVYHGHSAGVTAYSLEAGERLWHCKLDARVLSGCQTETVVYAATDRRTVHCLNKERGDEVAVYQCDQSVLSCAASPEGASVFAGDDNGSIYCFDVSGARRWKFKTRCGSAQSLQFLKDRLYAVTSAGVVACIDLTEGAVSAAQLGRTAALRLLRPPKEKLQIPDELETVSNPGGGVVLECVAEGSRVRVQPASPGYLRDWSVQFPKNLREPGARFVVEGLRATGFGGYYRAYGEIKRLVTDQEEVGLASSIKPTAGRGVKSRKAPAPKRRE